MLLVMLCLFFKHKTAYEMRISDWSSDVCSSDLGQPSARRDRCNRGGRCRSLRRRAGSLATRRQPHRSRTSAAPLHAGASSRLAQAPGDRGMTRRFYLRATAFAASARSEERRGGKEWVSKCGSRWSPDPTKKKKNEKN